MTEYTSEVLVLGLVVVGLGLRFVLVRDAVSEHAWVRIRVRVRVRVRISVRIRIRVKVRVRV